MDSAPLGYTPFLRPGATLFTIVCYQYFVHGQISVTRPISTVYGRVGGRKRNLFGIGAAKVSENVFGSSLSAIEILQSHTLFGVYSRALDPSGASHWAKMIVEEGRFERGSFHGMLPGRGMGGRRLELGTSELRSCASCVADDTANFGFAAWDVLHLLPPVHHCPKHGQPLVCEAEARPGRNLWKLGLPQGKGSSGISTKGPPPSDGYARYLQLWIELFEGRLPTAAFSAWPGYIEAAVEAVGSAHEAKRAICAAIHRLWGLYAVDVSGTLGGHVERDFVNREVSHRTTPARIAQKLVLITALESLGLAPDSGTCQVQMSLGLTGKASSKELFRHEVLAAGYSSALADLLMSDVQRSCITSELGLSSARIRRIVGGFPTELLRALNAEGEWSKKSWLATELRQRKVLKRAAGVTRE